jgi:hypothetical protein
LRNGEGADLKDTYGRTPLYLAAKGGHEVVMKLLLVRDEIEANPKDGLWFWVVLLDFQPNISERLLALVGPWTSSSASNYSNGAQLSVILCTSTFGLGMKILGRW